MKDYLGAPDNDATFSKNAGAIDHETVQQKHDKIHESIVSQHAFLTTAVPDFVKDLGPATLISLELMKSITNTPDATDVERYVRRIVARINVEVKLRDRLLVSLDIQRQVVSPLLYSHHSDAAFLLPIIQR